jgi:hypothetical protein
MIQTPMLEVHFVVMKENFQELPKMMESLLMLLVGLLLTVINVEFYFSFAKLLGEGISSRRENSTNILFDVPHSVCLSQMKLCKI